MRKELLRIALSLAITLSMLFTSVLTVSAAAPTIEEIEHKGNGRMEIDFYGKVRYKKTKVTVRDTSGKKYKVTKIRKDDDDIRFTIRNFKRGKTYKITISGIKKKGTKKYGKRTGRITIPGNQSTPAAITGARAAEIAKKHAADTWKAGQFWDVDYEKDTYAGQSVWDVDFKGSISGSPCEFEYKIAVNGGSILRYSHEYDD